MAPFVDETPISVLLEQVMNYTKRQMILLHGDLDDLETEIRDIEIIRLYDRAYRLGDINALTCIVNRFPINMILQGKNNGLPESTEEETKKSFKEIYAVIQSIVPDFQAMSEDEREIHDRKRNRRKNNILEENRRPGAAHYRKCFANENGKWRFYVRSFLSSIPDQHVMCLMKQYPDFDKNLFSLLPYQKIDWLCKHEDLHEKILIFLRTRSLSCVFSIEDIVDMENGKIEMTNDGPRY
ncbi:MAG: hypothetical protein IJI66_02640 [Erysipelotrichaceae bacterium]|nr:hypothetical protein [Erysipelotrichaceae bacterium]